MLSSSSEKGSGTTAVPQNPHHVIPAQAGIQMKGCQEPFAKTKTKAFRASRCAGEPGLLLFGTSLCLTPDGA